MKKKILLFSVLLITMAIVPFHIIMDTKIISHKEVNLNTSDEDPEYTDAKDFQYAFEITPSNISTRRLTIQYLGGFFEFRAACNPETYGYGESMMTIFYTDENNIQRDITYWDTPYHLFTWADPDNYTEFAVGSHSAGNVYYIKDTITEFPSDNLWVIDYGQNYTRGANDPSGITDFNVTEPILSTDNESLTWYLSYKVHSALKIPPWPNPPPYTAIWDINSTFSVNYTYHFEISNNSFHLKVSQKLYEFNLHPLMLGPLAEHGNLTHAWQINMMNQPSHTYANVNISIDGTSFASGEITDPIVVSDSANVSIDNQEILKVNFGSEFLLNETETRLLENTIDNYLYENNGIGIWYTCHFNDLNLTDLVSIEMDPELVLPCYYFDSGDDGDPDNPGGSRSIGTIDTIGITLGVIVAVSFTAYFKKSRHLNRIKKF